VPPSLAPGHRLGNHAVVTVTFALAGGPVPYVVAVYACRCGKTAEQHGHLVDLPDGWVRTEGSEPEHGDEYVCDVCAPKTGSTFRVVSVN
jgi:hypothetical protein